MLQPEQRIVITGIGLTAPNGDGLDAFRGALLEGRSGVQPYEIRYIGPTLAGICHYDTRKHQKKKELRNGTRAGSISIYCCREALTMTSLAPAVPRLASNSDDRGAHQSLKTA